MMAKNDRFTRGLSQSIAFETAAESEGSGSSDRIYTEIAASENSSALTRKSINLNPDREEFGIPTQILSLSDMSASERNDLRNKLRSELEQIHALQKKLEILRTNGITVSASNDIHSRRNGQHGTQVDKFRKSSIMTCGPGKKLNPSNGEGCGWNRGNSGRFESAVKQTSIPNAANIILMKQCEMLLKRLMSHQYGWVFNTPVDIVKWNIPDYFTVIKHPMDLGTIKGKFASGAYSSPLEFVADVRLTFSNAMLYNPSGNDFYIMADTLRKFFETRWKNIEKKLPETKPQALPDKSSHHDGVESTKSMPPAKKRKIETVHHEVEQEPIKRVMTDQEKHNLGRELESLLEDMPPHIIDFLKRHCSNGNDIVDDEIEIDIDDLSHDTLFSLRKLLDDHLKEKQENQPRSELYEIELLNESGLSNSSMQQGKGNEMADEDIDIGGNESPVSTYPPVVIEKDTGIKSSKCVSLGSSSDSSSSSDSECDDAKASGPINSSKVPEPSVSGAKGDPLDRNESVSGLDQLELTSQQKPNSVESDSREDGESAPDERQVSPEKLYRAALLKNRFADTILKAREKALAQSDKRDPEKLRQAREELELQKRKEKARIQAEARAVEEARMRAEAEAAAEAKRKRELERETARQALLEMEKTVEINENSRFLEDLEMLKEAAPAEQLPSSIDETSPEHPLDGLVSFKFSGSNPLEQLGLYMKEDDEEEDVELPTVPNPPNDVEEGEID